MPNPVVHFEVTGADAPKLQKFYADAFGWNVDTNNPMQYGLVGNEDGGIRGGISGGEQRSVTFYIAVDDPAAYLKKVVSLGGTVVQDVMTVMDNVTLAQFADPEGNIVGIVKDEPMA